MTFREVLKKDITEVFFEDFSIEDPIIYSGTGLPIKAILNDAIDMATGYQYQVIMVSKEEIGVFDPSQTITMNGLTYGLVNETVDEAYTDIYEIRLNKRGT